MHARVTRVRIQPGRVQEVLEIGRNSVAPAAREQQGFKGLFLLTDSVAGEGISVTLWETEEDLRASEQGGYYGEQMGKLADLLVAPPEKGDYEVSIQV
jgi:heme-degrading monooxygenase HmoA